MVSQIDVPAAISGPGLQYRLVRNPRRWTLTRQIRPRGCYRFRRNTAEQNGARRAYTPTPAQIAAATAQIRAGWSPQETEERWTGHRRVLWNPPEVKTSQPKLRIYADD